MFVLKAVEKESLSRYPLELAINHQLIKKDLTIC